MQQRNWMRPVFALFVAVGVVGGACGLSVASAPSQNTATASPEPASATPGQISEPGSGPLPGVGLVIGSVVSKAGEPVGECWIDRVPVTPELSDQEIGISSDAQGGFGVGLQPGIWNLKATCPSGESGTLESVAVPDQGTVQVTIVVDGGPVQPTLPALKWAKPVITGKAIIGKVLKAKTKGWTKGTTFKYTWKVAGKIKGHAARFKVKKAYLGKNVSLTVVGELTGQIKKAKAKVKVKVKAKQVR